MHAALRLYMQSVKSDQEAQSGVEIQDILFHRAWFRRKGLSKSLSVDRLRLLIRQEKKNVCGRDKRAHTKKGNKLGLEVAEEEDSWYEGHC